jgi:hypothetical protein
MVSSAFRQLKEIAITVGCTIHIPGKEYCLLTVLGKPSKCSAYGYLRENG